MGQKNLKRAGCTVLVLFMMLTSLVSCRAQKELPRESEEAPSEEISEESSEEQKPAVLKLRSGALALSGTGHRDQQRREEGDRDHDGKKAFPMILHTLSPSYIVLFKADNPSDSQLFQHSPNRICRSAHHK